MSLEYRFEKADSLPVKIRKSEYNDIVQSFVDQNVKFRKVVVEGKKESGVTAGIKGAIKRMGLEDKIKVIGSIKGVFLVNQEGE